MINQNTSVSYDISFDLVPLVIIRSETAPLGYRIATTCAIVGAAGCYIVRYTHYFLIFCNLHCYVYSQAHVKIQCHFID